VARCWSWTATAPPWAAVDEVVGIERVAQEAAGPPAGQRSPLVAGVLEGTRPLLLLDVGALTGWLAR